jgi:hypothetical protein
MLYPVLPDARGPGAEAEAAGRLARLTDRTTRTGWRPEELADAFEAKLVVACRTRAPFSMDVSAISSE